MSADISFQNGSLNLSGELDFQTAVSLWDKSLPLMRKAQDLQFDFSGIKSSNSAGLALILEWMKYAREHNKSISFISIPSQLQSIISVCGIKGLF